MLPSGNSYRTQPPSKPRTLPTEKGTKRRPKSSVLSAVKANNRALAAALDDSKQLCSKLKDEILVLHREKQELCETVSSLRLQLQSQHLDLRVSSLQTIVDQLSTAQQSIAQAKNTLTSRLGDHIHMSLSPILMRDDGSVGAANHIALKVNGMQFLSPPGGTSSPTGPSTEDGHASPQGGLTEHNSHRPLSNEPTNQDSYISFPNQSARQDTHTLSSDGHTRQNWYTGQEMSSLCDTSQRAVEIVSCERGRELNQDLDKEREENAEEEEEEEGGMSLNTELMQRPKRKCAPLSSSMVEPSLRDKLRRGDPFTTSFTTWSPCDRREKSRSRKRYSTKRVALANITNRNLKITD